MFLMIGRTHGSTAAWRSTDASACETQDQNQPIITEGLGPVVLYVGHGVADSETFAGLTSNLPQGRIETPMATWGLGQNPRPSQNQRNQPRPLLRRLLVRQVQVPLPQA